MSPALYTVQFKEATKSLLATTLHGRLVVSLLNGTRIGIKKSNANSCPRTIDTDYQLGFVSDTKYYPIQNIVGHKTDVKKKGKTGKKEGKKDGK